MEDDQVKSKERMSQFGEVYTSNREVVSMLDLVKEETERIESRFLEPACGDGNFLVEVTKRKHLIVEKKYKKNQFEFEKYLLLSISSVYGIDILEDNCIIARKRVFDQALNIYLKYFESNINENFINSIKFVIQKNIIHGDALTLKKVSSNSPITFSEWSLINNKIKRRDFTLDELLANAPFEKGTLFSDLGDDVFIPTPVKEFSVQNYDQLHK